MGFDIILCNVHCVCTYVCDICMFVCMLCLIVWTFVTVLAKRDHLRKNIIVQ